MDDITFEDPRKQSAKQIKLSEESKPKRRSVWQYLFDLIVKTLLCTVLLSLDFTLFANAGNYNLFLSSLQLTTESLYIYAGIAAISFVLMFLASLIKPLENIILAAIFALFCIAIINQFGAFDKHSGLLIIFNNIFSDKINAVLYEHSFLIISVAVFLFSWILLVLLKRIHLFYLLLLLITILGWVLSSAYFNTSVKYFKTITSAPALRSETIGKNLVFLSFHKMTSPNILNKMFQTSKKDPQIGNSFQNALGFFINNSFTLYPNAIHPKPENGFLDLALSYNPESEDAASSLIQTSVMGDKYFNFESLQPMKQYLTQNALYELLRKQGYNITVYQTEDMDTCYIDNKPAVMACKEKVNIPMILSDEYFSNIDKTILLASQWLYSTGFVSDINSILKVISYGSPYPQIKPLEFKAEKLSVVGAFKALDQIADSLDYQNGNQAYFAIIDFPAETYLYDSFCQMKPVDQWISEKDEYSKKSIDERRVAYAEQTNCLYGYLEKFMQQLEKSGMLSKTTVIIEGFDNPQGLNKPTNDYYEQTQNKGQTLFAIRKAGNNDENESLIDYKLCSVPALLKSFFFSHRPCEEFEGVKMSDKLATTIREQIEKEKYLPSVLDQAKKDFMQWFNAWSAHNQFESLFINRAQPYVANQDDGLETEEITQEDTNQEENVPENEEQAISNQPQTELQYNNQKSEQKADESKTTSEAKNQDLSEDNTVSKSAEINDAAESSINTVNQENNVAEDDKTVNEKVGEDVIPETLYDTVKIIQQAQEQEVVAKQERSLEVVKDQKPQQIKKVEKIEKVKKIEEPKTTVKQDIDIINRDDSLKQVLEAPVAGEKKLSPEELKKQYHDTLKKAAKMAEPKVKVEVKVVEN